MIVFVSQVADRVYISFTIKKKNSKVVFSLCLNSNYMKSTGDGMIIGKFGHYR